MALGRLQTEADLERFVTDLLSRHGQVQAESLKGQVRADQIPAAAVDEDHLATSVAGDGLTGGAGSPLAVGAGDGLAATADAVAVNVDDSTIEIDSDTLRVKAVEAWNSVSSFDNSWVNEGGGTYYDAQYMKDHFGFVHLRGAIKNGTMNATAFTLPAGYRPSKALELPVVSYTGVAYNADSVVTIFNDGRVRPTRGNNVFFWLDGIAFKAD